MDAIALMDAGFTLLAAASLGFLAYGGWLVATCGGFHRDAPEDACHPQLLVTDL